MATVIKRKAEDCDCSQCGTYAFAEVTVWSCTCIEVDLYMDRTRCEACKDFNNRRFNCGRPGDAANH